MTNLLWKLAIGIGFLLFPFLPVAADEEPEIIILGPKVDSANFNGELVAEALDDYVSPLIGGHVRLEFVEIERYNQVFSKYQVSDQMPDVFFMSSGDLLDSYWKNNEILSLNELLESDGQGILETLDSESLNIHTSDKGEIYAIPCLHDRPLRIGFEYRTDIAEKYGLDMENVEDLDDLTSVFASLKSQAPDIFPCSDIEYTTWDPLGDSLGVLMDYGRTATVTNLYSSSVYKDFYRYVYLWNENGYLLSDDIGLLSTNSYVSSPEIFGKFSKFHPALTYVDSADAGEEIRCIPLTESYLYTDIMTYDSFAISSSCAYPDLAMKFLNLMYTDPNVMNLLAYGIEGVHYQVIDSEKGIIDFADGVSRENSEYAQFRSYFWGNQFLTYVWNGYPTDLWEQVQQFNQDAPRSLAFGFRYDPQPVSEEVYSCQQIVASYLPLLNAGVGDLDTILTDFCQELTEAGIDKIISEKQRQLDAFLEGTGES